MTSVIFLISFQEKVVANINLEIENQLVISIIWEKKVVKAIPLFSRV